MPARDPALPKGTSERLTLARANKLGGRLSRAQGLPLSKKRQGWLGRL